MKKNFKLVLALVLAIMMVAAMIPAMAEPEDVTLTLPDSDHTYEIYQIFTGELADGKLSNIHWGANGTGTEGDLVPQDTLDAIAAITGTDTEKAAALSAYADLTNPIASQAGGDVTVKTGYYLIKDADNVDLEEGDEHTLFIVAIVDDTEITRKASTTESHKTVGDINDSTDTETATGLKSSDYDIGDDVPYHLTATLSQKVEQYKKYHITFKDTLQSGSFDEISALDIKMGGAAIAETDDYTVEITGADDASAAGFEVTIEFTPKEDKNLSSLNGAEITIDFTAKLGEGAKIGSEGNKNTFNVKYSNNPNDEDGGEEGETPEEQVITFTYKVVVNKVDENEEPLSGAEFALYKIPADAAAPTGDDAKDAAAKNAYYEGLKIQEYEVGGIDPNFEIKGVDDGTYVLCETKTPDGYNTIDPKVFVIEAVHDDDTLALTDLTGTGDITLERDTANEDALTVDIMNQSGAVLPTTGGIGTTIFYVAGSILVLAAAILLVTKRRMSAND